MHEEGAPEKQAVMSQFLTALAPSAAAMSARAAQAVVSPPRQR